MATFIIPVTVKDDLKKRLEKVAKKAAAYHCRFEFSFGSETVVSRNVFTVDPVTHRETFTGTENVFGIELTINSDIIKKGDYIVVAGIEHDPAGNIVNKFDDNTETDLGWYHIDPFCQHCGTRHAKRYTFIVKDPAGHMVQVGKSCLKDYCGIDPAMIAISNEIRDLIVNEYDIDSYDFTGSGDYAYDVCDVIAIANDIIKKHGYVKSSENMSTKYRLVSDYGKMEPSKDSLKLANDMREYFSRLDYADLTDYQRNIKSLLAAGYTRTNSFGYLAYAPVAYKQMIEKDARKQMQKETAANSNYIGKVGDRITSDIKESKLVTSWETVYGYTYLYKFVTADNNTLVWFASRSIDGDPKRITGTVKEHKDYNGEKQTILTRCKVM